MDKHFMVGSIYPTRGGNKAKIVGVNLSSEMGLSVEHYNLDGWSPTGILYHYHNGRVNINQRQYDLMPLDDDFKPTVLVKEWRNVYLIRHGTTCVHTGNQKTHLGQCAFPTKGAAIKAALSSRHWREYIGSILIEAEVRG